MFVGKKLDGSRSLLNATPSDGADAGYGTSDQAGVLALLDELLIGQGSEPLRLRS